MEYNGRIKQPAPVIIFLGEYHFDLRNTCYESTWAANGQAPVFRYRKQVCLVWGSESE